MAENYSAVDPANMARLEEAISFRLSAQTTPSPHDFLKSCFAFDKSDGISCKKLGVKKGDCANCRLPKKLRSYLDKIKGSLRITVEAENCMIGVVISSSASNKAS